ncbi:hypothetical protein [Anthocerotibacter panamensis]|uniref:hypothetical protein n=1 Tax=Anthocerotibacter panamensis TaxID=2857077 RepID=UPI001C408C81|nr:hypothetical protein [Anthocerotibacter panamensis]
MTDSPNPKLANDEALWIQLSTAFSIERLKPYLKAAQFDKQRALKLYELNTTLSQELYPLLSVLEIVLRNRINNVMVKYFGDLWFERYEGRWFNGESLPIEPKVNHQWDEVQKAKKDLQGAGKKITADRLTAELSFGFWTGMLGDKYERILWHKYADEVFQDKPKNLKVNDRIKGNENVLRNKFYFELVRWDLGLSRLLRNRVSHHEPILPIIYNKSLRWEYERTKWLLSWLSQDALEWLETCDCFGEVLERIDKTFRAPAVMVKPLNVP